MTGLAWFIFITFLVVFIQSCIYEMGIIQSRIQSIF